MMPPPVPLKNEVSRCTFEAVTRRDFLKSTALAAGSALIPAASASASPGSKDSMTSEKLEAGWEYFQGSLGGVWDVWRKDTSDSTAWKKIYVPHCFNAYDAVDPERPYYEGPGWYRRKIQVRNPFENGRTLLVFEGAGQKCEVFIALGKVGSHVGGYDEFVIDITEATAGSDSAEFPLAVLCDNSRDPGMIPSALNDFHRVGGLYRKVSLVYEPKISLKRLHITTAIADSASAQVSITAKLRDQSAQREDLQLRMRVFDPQGAVVQTATGRFQTWNGEREVASFKLEKPQLWSPSQPSLYRCEVQLTSAHGTNTVSERFGCRYFEFVEHGPFIFNGQRLFLKGTQREEDYAGLGAAVPDDLIRQEMLLMKQMGANFVGLAHHQQSRPVLELCDELGLLVLEQLPWSRGGLGGDNYKQLAREMLRSMIDQHYNHPSIVLWGLGNENDWSGDYPGFNEQQIREFVKDLGAEAHRLDPRRPTFLRRCDFCKDLVDVYSPSIWAGWYHGQYTQYKETLEKQKEAVPRFLHVEWGAESHARRHSEEPDQMLAQFLSASRLEERERTRLLNGGHAVAAHDGDWSETYACNLFDWHLKEQETIAGLTGSAQWIFKDFSTPLRPENPIPHVNQKGLLERDMTPKEGYYVFQSYWAETPMIHIYGHSWPTRWGREDELKLVKVYSNCESAELFVNGASEGSKHRDPQNFPAAGFHWLVRLQAGENRITAVGRAKSATVQDSLTFQYQTKRWGPPARIVLSEIGRNGGVVKVEAQVLDTQATLCLDGSERVWFGITGDGALIDNLGTSTGSRCLGLYNGRAEIRLSLNGGTSVLSARCGSHPTAFLTLK